MNDLLDIELILKKQKYSSIYSLGTIILIILLVFLYITSTYDYQTYYISKGIAKNDKIELLVNLDDIKYIVNNNTIKIDNILYSYSIDTINEEIYVNENYENYKYVYLYVNNLSSINNYVYEIKLAKENKKIIQYILDYF